MAESLIVLLHQFSMCLENLLLGSFTSKVTILRVRFIKYPKEYTSCSLLKGGGFVTWHSGAIHGQFARASLLADSLSQRNGTMEQHALW